jgi:hypothetical protein
MLRINCILLFALEPLASVRYIRRLRCYRLVLKLLLLRRVLAYNRIAA